MGARHCRGVPVGHPLPPPMASRRLPAPTASAGRSSPARSTAGSSPALDKIRERPQERGSFSSHSLCCVNILRNAAKGTRLSWQRHGLETRSLGQQCMHGCSRRWLPQKCGPIPRMAGKRRDGPQQLSPAREGRRVGGSVPPILPATHPDHQQILDRT